MGTPPVLTARLQTVLSSLLASKQYSLSAKAKWLETRRVITQSQLILPDKHAGGASNKLKRERGEWHCLPLKRGSPSPLFLVDKKESQGRTWTLSKKKAKAASTHRESE